ncbi:YgdI/YgdR family lipoprotein [Stutzerimonas kunmingensis]|uniref:YgdI/YgdR family lipoprotein n=1 Tax=Stutzerimonas kunmingensis TaxID=1211807 RepID=UPI00241CE770|nr:YgdI/YgdR family lipoprotein [Stutzerimonas kunmingensis]
MQPRIIPALLLALGFTALAGCANPSVITLNDGREIQTLDHPDFDDESGFYEYEQIDGKPGKVNKDQVRTVREL